MTEEERKERARIASRAYYQRNKAKVCAHFRAYRQARLAEYTAWQREYEVRRKEKRRLYNLAYRSANREKKLAKDRERRDQQLAYRTEHKARIIAVQKRWRDNNRHRVSANAATRKAIKIKATPKWANRKAIAEFYRTAKRLTLETGVRYEVDHIIPLRSKAVCGLHCEANLQILTRSDNRRKWSYLPHQLSHAAASSGGSIFLCNDDPKRDTNDQTSCG